MKGFIRCGICDQDFENTEEWNEHKKGERHHKLIAIWKLLEVEARIKNRHFIAREEMAHARKIVDEEHISWDEMIERHKKALQNLMEKFENGKL